MRGSLGAEGVHWFNIRSTVRSIYPAPLTTMLHEVRRACYITLHSVRVTLYPLKNHLPLQRYENKGALLTWVCLW
jgi:hypothetical protein